MRGNVTKRHLALLVRADPFAIVAHDEYRTTTATTPLDNDRASIGIDRILYELGDRLARIALAASEPANQIERVCRLELHPAGIALRPRPRHAARMPNVARSVARARQKSRDARAISTKTASERATLADDELRGVAARSAERTESRKRAPPLRSRLPDDNCAA